MLELLNDSELEQVSGGRTEQESETYTVKAGENMAAIATRYGTTVAVIMSLNPQLKNPADLRPGKKIVVPKK